VRLFARELRTQQRLFWRSRESAFFTFALPLVLLILLGTAYGDEEVDGIRASTYLLAGFLGYGIVATAFAGLAISIVVRRESGVLKRVRGTPLPSGVYLGALIASTLAVMALETIAQLLVGRFLLDAGWPASPLSFALTIVLGVAAFAALGLAVTGFVKSSEGSSAIVNAIYLPMIFISGVFFSRDTMPGFLQALADVLPLTYLLELLREVFVEGGGLDTEAGAVAVVAVWGIAGFALALRMFKWEPREV
jgi:ABC-2 type transport system permease protein